MAFVDGALTLLVCHPAGHSEADPGGSQPRAGRRNEGRVSSAAQFAGKLLSLRRTFARVSGSSAVARQRDQDYWTGLASRFGEGAAGAGAGAPRWSARALQDVTDEQVQRFFTLPQGTALLMQLLSMCVGFWLSSLCCWCVCVCRRERSGSGVGRCRCCSAGPRVVGRGRAPVCAGQSPGGHRTIKRARFAKCIGVGIITMDEECSFVRSTRNRDPHVH